MYWKKKQVVFVTKLIPSKTVFLTHKAAPYSYFSKKKKKPGIVASMFLRFLQISGSCSYKIVLLKKRVRVLLKKRVLL